MLILLFSLSHVYCTNCSGTYTTGSVPSILKRTPNRLRSAPFSVPVLRESLKSTTYSLVGLSVSVITAATPSCSLVPLAATTSLPSVAVAVAKHVRDSFLFVDTRYPVTALTPVILNFAVFSGLSFFTVRPPNLGYMSLAPLDKGSPVAGSILLCLAELKV